MMLYKYGYRLRPPAIATEPRGYIKQILQSSDNYWGYVTYNRKLTEEEMFEYDLDLVEVTNIDKIKERKKWEVC